MTPEEAVSRLRRITDTLPLHDGLRVLESERDKENVLQILRDVLAQYGYAKLLEEIEALDIR